MLPLKEPGVLDISIFKEISGTLSYMDQIFLNDNDNGTDPKIHRFLKSLGLPAKMHFMSIIFCTGGTGKARVSMKEYRFKRNDMFLVSGGSIVESMEISNDFKAEVISVTPVSFVANSNRESSKILRQHLIVPEVITFSQDSARQLKQIYDWIKLSVLEPEGENIFQNEAIEGLMLLYGTIIANKLSKQSVDIKNVTQWNGNEMMRRFLIEVSQHYSEERSISYYANQLCVSNKYFAQVIFKESGKYAKDWIREYVIRDAKTMLKSGKYTIQEISDTLHFANPSFFGKYFKEAVGCSPRAFRAKYEDG